MSQKYTPYELVQSLKSELRRRKTPIFAAFVFFMGLVFTFLAVKNLAPSTAVSTEGFRPGNIISDAVMANSNSMTKEEIQAFLTAKNPCNNRNYKLYQEQSALYPKISWHWTGDANSGHFVCLSEETFGDGVELGVAGGKTAAEIIYDAAKEYQINPQVLLVLLEKEQGLITDTYPHSNQYRSATGYGCPDTAACDSKYYGFKNQVFRAAELFRYTLDNGSYLYPDNTAGVYVAYNPNSACGGSEVFIENRATSALYRYTPYQPNSSALAAGFGLGNSCSAYGNRNFYLYFSQWFGDPHADPFSNMDISRVLQVKSGSTYYDATAGTSTEQVSDVYIYATAKRTINGKLCLADSASRAAGKCIFYDNLTDYPTVQLDDMSIPRYLSVASSSLHLQTGKYNTDTKDQLLHFTHRVTISDQLYLATSADSQIIYPYDHLQELSAGDISVMDIPRALLATTVAGINLSDGTFHQPSPDQNNLITFTSKVYLNGQLCLGTDELLQSSSWCVPYDSLQEIPAAVPPYRMDIPRNFYIPAQTPSYNISTGISSVTEQASLRHFSYRTTFLGELCLQPDGVSDTCYRYSDLHEVATLSPMDIPRRLVIQDGAKYLSTYGITISEQPQPGEHWFSKRTDIDGKLCLADDDTPDRCIPYDYLREL